MRLAQNIDPSPPTTQAPLPKYSLPRYADPTPSAAHRKLPREEEADLALKNTKFTPGTRQTLIALFLLTILAVPVIQLVGEFRAAGSISRLPMISIFKSLPWLPHAEDLKRVERTLENESLVSQWLLPRVQYLLTVLLGAGNEQVYLGHDPWLFYRADVDHVIGPPFLDPVRMKHRLQTSRVQPDPIKAIVDFRNQLAARGIDLVVLPVSVKPSVEGEMLAVSNANRAQASGASTQSVFQRIQSPARTRESTPVRSCAVFDGARKKRASLSRNRHALAARDDGACCGTIGRFSPIASGGRINIAVDYRKGNRRARRYRRDVEVIER